MSTSGNPHDPREAARSSLRLTRSPAEFVPKRTNTMPANIPEDQDFEDLFARQIPGISAAHSGQQSMRDSQHSRDASGTSGLTAPLEVWDPPTNSRRPAKEEPRDPVLRTMREQQRKEAPGSPGSPDCESDGDMARLAERALSLRSAVPPMEEFKPMQMPASLRAAYEKADVRTQERLYYQKLLHMDTPATAEVARALNISPQIYEMMKMRDIVRQTKPHSTFPFFNGDEVDNQVANYPMDLLTQPDPPPPQVSQYVVVCFKHHRAEVFLQPQSMDFANPLKLGEMVVVQADRGENVGQVWHICTTLLEAERLARSLNSDQLNNLLNFARTYVGQAKALSPLQSNYKASPQPGWIMRRAEGHYLLDLQRKEHDETKAKRIAAQKAEDMGFPLEILDTEFQIDHQKLTIYYISSEYVRFKELVNNIYKIYKMRIWMSSINPQHPHEASDDLWSTPPMEANPYGNLRG
ncbi:MAG: hypothetical protein Q9162_001020 [Coniocarpon cinnabarinum]